MKIFSNKNSQSITKLICDSLNKEITEQYEIGQVEAIVPGNLHIDNFSDGEMLPLFKESVRGVDIFYVSSPNSAEFIMETLLVVDAAKRSGCKSFTLVAPFMPYSRQDKTDHLRSSIGSKVMADVLEKVGVTRLITIDLHASSIQGFYNIPVIHLNGNKIFFNYIKELGLDDLCILSPDQGAVKRASDFCKAFPDSTFAMINKKRVKPNVVESMELVGDVKGKNVIIVDDMADTMGTMKKASELIMESGAKSVRSIATHGVLSGKAYDNLEESPISELIVSDSINQSSHNKLKVVTCTSLIAKCILTLERNKSINEINIV